VPVAVVVCPSLESVPLTSTSTGTLRTGLTAPTLAVKVFKPALSLVLATMVTSLVTAHALPNFALTPTELASRLMAAVKLVALRSHLVASVSRLLAATGAEARLRALLFLLVPPALIPDTLLARSNLPSESLARPIKLQLPIKSRSDGLAVLLPLATAKFGSLFLGTVITGSTVLVFPLKPF